MMKIMNNRGMSLMETLTAAMIFVTIFILTFGCLSSGNRLWAVTDASSRNQLEVRRALMDMERTVRSATSVVTAQPSGKGVDQDLLRLGLTQVSFERNNSTYQYYLASDTQGTGLYQLHERISSGSGALLEDKVIANNIVSCAFHLEFPENGERMRLHIEITARKTTTSGDEINFTLKHIATLRNADSSFCIEGDAARADRDRRDSVGR